MDFPTLSSKVLEIAEGLGAVGAEIYAKTGSSSDIRMYGGKVDSISTAEEEGLGIRFVLSGNRTGYCYTVDTSEENVRQLLAESIRGTEEADRAPGLVELAEAREDPGPSSEELGIWSGDVPATSLEEKIEFLRKVEAAAHEADRNVSWVDTLVYHDGWTEVHLRSSAGFQGSYRRTQTHVVLNVMASQGGESVLSHHESAACSFAALDPIAIGSVAARRASAPLGGRRIGPRRVTVVLDAFVAAELLEFIAPSFLGRTHLLGRSLFQEKMGEEVASPLLTILDEGRLKGGLSTAPFDGEGSPTSTTTIVEKGVLQAMLHDRATASAAREVSTGNAMRRSYRDQPRPGATNLMIRGGGKPTSELLIDVEVAFHVLNLTGVGGVNPVTGNFSVVASGVWIEEGRYVHAVGGVILSGDLKEMLRNVVAVGDDTAWHHGNGSFGSPTLVVEGLTVAG